MNRKLRQLTILWSASLLVIGRYPAIVTYMITPYIQLVTLQDHFCQEE